MTPKTPSPSIPFRSARGRGMVAVRTNPSERAEALVEHDRTPLRDWRLAAVPVAVCPVQTFRGLVEREMTQGLRRARSHVCAEELFDGAVVNPERSLLLYPKALERPDEPREVASRVGQIVLVEVDPHHARSAPPHVFRRLTPMPRPRLEPAERRRHGGFEFAQEQLGLARERPAALLERAGPIPDA